MRRFFTSLVLALFVGVPSLQVRCVILCAADDAPESATSQIAQKAPVPSPVVGTHDDCASQVTPNDFVAPRSAAPTRHVLSVVHLVIAPVLTPTAAEVRSHDCTPSSGPPGRFVIPLRV